MGSIRFFEKVSWLEWVRDWPGLGYDDEPVSQDVVYGGDKDVRMADLTCGGGCGNGSFCIHRRRRQPYGAIGINGTQKTAAERRRCRVQNAVILTRKGFRHFFARHVNGKRQTKGNVQKDFSLDVSGGGGGNGRRERSERLGSAITWRQRRRL